MFCPNCGQQQASEQMKFCSRCGFPLALVSQILSHGGFLPQLATLGSKKHLLTRKNVFLFGLVWFLVAILLVIPITAVLFGDAPVGEAIIPFVAILGTMGGLLLMLFSLFFKTTAQMNAEIYPQKQNFIPQHQLNTPMNQSALPPQPVNFVPVNQAYSPPLGNWREAKTGELVQPSVTEGTTRLLDKEPQ